MVASSYDLVNIHDDKVVVFNQSAPDELPSVIVDEANVESSLLNKATWLSCYINLSSTIMGAGVLGLPHAFAHTGWAGGLLLLAICAVSSGLALHFLSKCAKVMRTQAIDILK